MRRFVELLNVTSTTSVLDVGGDLANWQLLPRHSRPRVTILNVFGPRSSDESTGTAGWVIGDGRELPFPDRSFDVVFSNSVIEHVGELEDQRRFAKEICRVGKRYFVQTPNRGFPIEPHLLTPGFQFLPRSAYRRLTRNCTVWGLLSRPSSSDAAAFAAAIRLLDRKALEGLFPGCTILSERFLGLCKSLVAWR